MAFAGRDAQPDESLQRCIDDLNLIERIVHLGRWGIDTQVDLFHPSVECARLLGIPTQPVPVADAFVHVHPDDREAMLTALRAVLGGGAPLDIDYRVVKPNGDVRYLCNESDALRFEAGRAWLRGTTQDISRRKRIEQALRESEQRFRAFAEAATEGIIVHEGGRILDTNPAMAAHLGYTVDELRRLTILDITAPESRPEVLRRVQANDPGPYMASSLHKDGSSTYGEIRAGTITHRGKPTRMVVIRDITEVRRAQSERERLLAELNAALDALVDGLVIFDMTLQPVRVNRAVRERLDTLGAMIPQSPEDRAALFHIRTADGTPLAPEEMPTRRAQRGEIVHNLVLHLMTPTGQTCWASLCAAPIRLPDGTQVGVILTLTDITRLHEAQTQLETLLHDEERRAAEVGAVIDSIADGVVVYDAAGALIRANTAAAQILGLDTPGQTLTDRLAHLHILTADGRPAAAAQLPSTRALQGETVHGLVFSIVRPDGETHWLSHSAAPIRAADGTLLGAVVTFSDITPQRELQRRQEELLHIVSHDLRMPLTVIHGHMELLEDALATRGLDSEIRLSTSTIDRNVQRMNAMIQDLVDMARLEGGQLRLHLEAVRLQDYLPDLFARLRETMPVTRVVAEIPADLPPVYADYSRLERILLNLLSNAFKYSAPETPVDVRARRNGTSVEIMVRDHGRGIDPRDLPHLFERFYRTVGERVAEGLGLGLYITRLLVEAQGGRIRAESALDAGSAFYVTLPVAA